MEPPKITQAAGSYEATIDASPNHVPAVRTLRLMIGRLCDWSICTQALLLCVSGLGVPSVPSVGLAAGGIDRSFGTNGFVVDSSFSGSAPIFSCEIDDLQRIVVAGRLGSGTTQRTLIMRYNYDGSLDESFASGGKFTLTGGPGGSAMIIDRDRRILVGGSDPITDGQKLIRLTENGELDPSFGSDGVVTTSFYPNPTSGRAGIGSIVLLVDGGFVTVGGYQNYPAYPQGTIARYSNEGALYEPFNNVGFVKVNVTSWISGALLAESAIIVTGGSCNAQGSYCSESTRRYHLTGARDLNFSPGSSFDGAYGGAAVVDTAGRIVVGAGSSTSASKVALVRYSESGTLDESFGSGGRVVDPRIRAPLTDVAIDDSGRILAVPYSEFQGVPALSVFRYGNNGAPDYAFGAEGIARSPFSVNGYGSCVRIDANGSIVVAGYVQQQYSRPALVRYLGKPECSDGLDNDGDGFVDFPDDPGCASPESLVEDPACDDGIDNDGDGLIDFPADPGCAGSWSTMENPACDDGVDNDADGAIDFPDDPGCASFTSNSESPQCDDRIDNDGDGRTDYPEDPKCFASWDPSETVCDNLWNIKWFGCDYGHNNEFALNRDGGPVCGSGNCPTSPCWNTPTTRKSFSSGGVSWATGPLGDLSLSHSQDVQVYGDTYLYANEMRTVASPFVRDVGRIWVNGEDVTPATDKAVSFKLSPGWNHLEWTSYNQNQGTHLKLSGLFSLQADRMNSTPVVCDPPGGFIPPDKAALRCEKGVESNAVALAACLMECDVKRRKAELEGVAFGRAACTVDDPKKSCFARYARKQNSLLKSGACPDCLQSEQQSALAQEVATALLPAGASTRCSSGVAAGSLSCQSHVARNLQYLMKCLASCDFRVAKEGLGGKAFDEVACKASDARRSCRAKYDFKQDRLVAQSACPACLSGEQQTVLANRVQAAFERFSRHAYCSGSQPTP